jgi:hypothetical protein
MERKEHPDWALIHELGGPAQVARELEIQDNGVQVVQNWKYRGIPSSWKVKRPDLFLPHLSQRRKARA